MCSWIPRLICAFFISFFSFGAFSNEAKIASLWQDPFWLKLVHYEKNEQNKFQSLADGSDFFLSPKGPWSPEAEFKANTEALFNFSNPYKSPDQAPWCRFPLRYTWLRSQLRPEAPKHSELDCPKYKSWSNRLGATSAHLVFASSYVNNPASMFGHTFIRFGRTQRGHTLPPMLHYTANFAAETGNEGGMLYTLKGLFGAYPGVFSTFPHYINIQKYNNNESRDLWEYELDLTQKEIDQLVMHLWELGSTHFAYYFIDENCSLFLLSFLNILRPQKNLIKQLPFFTIPIDTLKVTKSETDWIRKVRYRPSRLTLFKHQYAHLSKKERRAFGDLQKTHILSKKMSEVAQSRILDTAVLLDEYRFDDKRDSPIREKLLAARSEIERQENTFPPVVTPSNPLKAHQSSSIGVGGKAIDSHAFASFYLRGAYHELLNPQQGFNGTSQIEGLSSQFLIGLDRQKLLVDYVNFVKIISLTPIEKYIRKPSWNLDFGWNRTQQRNCRDCGVLRFVGGPGFTVGSSKEQKRRLLFGFFNMEVGVAPWNEIDFLLNPQGELGALMDLGSHLSAKLGARAVYSTFEKDEVYFSGQAELALHLKRNFELRARFERTHFAYEGGLRVIHHF